MKPLALVILFAACGATGLSIAQSKNDMNTKEMHIKVVSSRCAQDSTNKNCVKLAPPPTPPAPPALNTPKVPKTPNTPPAPPAPPLPPDLADLPALPDLPPPPAPPAPPEPPEIVIPNEVHQACQNKNAGTAASWRQDKSAYYAGVCVKRDGKMVLDVHQISLYTP